MKRLVAITMTLATLAVAGPEAAAQFGFLDVGHGGVRVGFGNGDVGVALKIGDRHRYRRGRGHVHTSACLPVYRPGYWEVERVRVRRPGYWKRVWEPARYVVTHRYGRRHRERVRRGRWRRVRVGGGYVYETRRRWVEGYTTYSCG